MRNPGGIKGTIYLDNAATTMSNQQVADKAWETGVIGWGSAYRGMYDRSIKITDEYEKARKRVAAFAGAEMSEEIVFTYGTTDGMNKLARVLADDIPEGSEILLGIAEHSSVLLPWRREAKRRGFNVRYLPVDEEGYYTPEALGDRLTSRTRVVCIAQAGNVMGAVNDISTLSHIAHRNGAYVIADCAQSAPHGLMNVLEMGCDFAAWSGHKMMCPYGIGALYGQIDLLEHFGAPVVGGESAWSVRKEEIRWAGLPHKWEAGTVNAVGAVALSEACGILQSEPAWQKSIEADLIERMHRGLASIPHVRLLGPSDPKKRHSICAFQIEGVHPHDAGSVYASDGICVRTGYHCAEMLHEALGIGPTIRASVYFYNTAREIDAFLNVTADMRKRMGIA